VTTEEATASAAVRVSSATGGNHYQVEKSFECYEIKGKFIISFNSPSSATTRGEGEGDVCETGAAGEADVSLYERLGKSSIAYH
jgi:hypothetical protein